MIDFATRDVATGTDELFWQRWSPKAFTKTTLSEDVVTRLVDAARWSPSCFNEQPWRIFTSTEQSFDDFLALLVEGNRAWAKDASLLGFMVAKKQFDRNGNDNNFARFDCGAAWMALSLQARKEGLYSHGMGGINYAGVADFLAIDQSQFEVVMGFAVGVATPLDQVSDPDMLKTEASPRLPLADIWQQR